MKPRRLIDMPEEIGLNRLRARSSVEPGWKSVYKVSRQRQSCAARNLPGSANPGSSGPSPVHSLPRQAYLPRPRIMASANHRAKESGLRAGRSGLRIAALVGSASTSRNPVRESGSVPRSSFLTSSRSSVRGWDRTRPVRLSGRTAQAQRCGFVPERTIGVLVRQSGRPAAGT
jgi:hypothetical protein